MRKNFLFFLGAAAGACLTLLVTTPQGALSIAAAGLRPVSTPIRSSICSARYSSGSGPDYVEKPDDTKLIEGAINGMVTSLDPHSRYMNEKAWGAMRETTSGEFGGLGMEVTMEDGLLKVVAPMDGTPAARAGILSGDMITHIDDTAVKGLTLEQAVIRMKGPIGSKTRLKITRKGTERPVEVSVAREVIRTRPVRYRAEGGDIGYIKITTFNEQTTEGLKKAIADISKQNSAGETGRLRCRPAQQPRRLARSGGLGFQRVPGARRGGVDARTNSRGDAAFRRAERRSDQGQTAGGPDQRRIGVGVGDRGRCVARSQTRYLIGSRSFGKGSVQTIIPLGAGKGALALTTARYFTPSGQSIQAKGIAPDIEVLQEVPMNGNPAPRPRARPRSVVTCRPTAPSSPARISYVPSSEKDDKALVRPTICCGA